MKNKEKYVDDIIAIASNGYNIAVRRVYEQVVGCEATDCRDCVFLEGNCAENRQKWFESEAAPTIDELKSELETLKKERDELRARLEKAVELPVNIGGKIWEIFDNTLIFERNVYHIGLSENRTTFRLTGESGLFYLGEVELTDYKKTWFTAREAAEARLKELQGGER